MRFLFHWLPALGVATLFAGIGFWLRHREHRAAHGVGHGRPASVRSPTPQQARPARGHNPNDSTPHLVRV